ncbi:DUF3127 domain-containing protein [Marivirga arenosa]|uniref:DUF3127 domain-containing protein n=1 Tax=Marivirga arenosa TaxID=3059076 RepID=A0AA51ZV41_9BACT|nr:MULTISPECIES: DUF3127 domain-containing protein [unclassified Marivirga]WKK85132.2 DUF3127 domain-containing protein [Marivirga sp. ABR2-2]WNB17297.1 DUF3127 domain-containing protein [Marivirga sp. BKB1-2]
MELKGKVIDILPEEKGQGKNGEWRKQSYIIETQEQYPKKVCAEAWGDKIDGFNIKKGEELTAKINIDSREYNGKWYTNVKIWSVEKASDGNLGGIPNASTPPPAGPPASGAQDTPPPPSEDDELPF